MKPHLLMIYMGKDKKFWWRAKSGNNKIVDASEQGYASKYYARDKALHNYPGGEVVFVNN